MKIKRIFCIFLSLSIIVISVANAFPAFATNNIKPSDFNITKTSINAKLHNEVSIDIEGIGTYYDNIVYKWTSSNTKVLPNQNNGRCYWDSPKGFGKTTLTCTIYDKNNKSIKIQKKCKVTITSGYGIILSDDKRPMPKINGKAYSGWKSSNKKAVIIKNGKYFGKGNQKASTLTKTVGGVKYSYKVYSVSRKRLQKMEPDMNESYYWSYKNFNRLNISEQSLEPCLMDDGQYLYAGYGGGFSYNGKTVVNDGFAGGL